MSTVKISIQFTHLDYLWLDDSIKVTALQPAIICINQVKKCCQVLLWLGHEQDGDGQDCHMDQQVQGEDQDCRGSDPTATARHHPLATRIEDFIQDLLPLDLRCVDLQLITTHRF